MEQTFKHARILIVDGEPQSVRYLAEVLRWAGYEHIEGTTDPHQALSIFRHFQPDLVILALIMPEMDGFAVLEAIQKRVGEDDYLPILMLSSDASQEARRRALAEGARDFLAKPTSPTEVSFRVANLLESRFLHLRCKRLQEQLRQTGAAAALAGPATAHQT